MAETFQQPMFAPVGRPPRADHVFGARRRRILAQDLPPDAFSRHSRPGFLPIRPRRAATLTLNPQGSAMRARFLRTALVVEAVRTHPARIRGQIAVIRAANHDWFTGGA
jgi:hypothetical protein